MGVEALDLMPSHSRQRQKNKRSRPETAKGKPLGYCHPRWNHQCFPIVIPNLAAMRVQPIQLPVLIATAQMHHGWKAG